MAQVAIEIIGYMSSAHKGRALSMRMRTSKMCDHVVDLCTDKDMKTVLLSYLERKKNVKIPDDVDSDLKYIENKFRLMFSYSSNVSITISFQRYDKDWNEILSFTQSTTKTS